MGPSPHFLQAEGFSLSPNTVIVPHFTRTEDSLAFGPQGQVETWGSGQVTAVVSAGG